MAGKYLGETPVAIADSPFANYTTNDWILEYVGSYGQIDGAHHKQWVLDQVARLANGAPIINLRKAEWDCGTVNWRFEIGTSEEYEAWVDLMKGDWDPEFGDYEYEYDEGIAP